MAPGTSLASPAGKPSSNSPASKHLKLNRCLTSSLSASKPSTSSTCMCRSRPLAGTPLARSCSCSSSASMEGMEAPRGMQTRCTESSGVWPFCARSQKAADSGGRPHTSTGRSACSAWVAPASSPAGCSAQQHSARSCRRWLSGMAQAAARDSASWRQLAGPGGSKRCTRSASPAIRCSRVRGVAKRRPERSAAGTARQVLARSPQARRAAAMPSPSVRGSKGV